MAKINITAFENLKSAAEGLIVRKFGQNQGHHVIAGIHQTGPLI